VSLTPGVSRSSTTISDLVLTPPAGVPFTRDGHAVIAATWTEQSGADPACSRTAGQTLEIAPLTERPVVRVTRHLWSDRPWVSFTVTVTRSQFGVPDPIVLGRLRTGILCVHRATTARAATSTATARRPEAARESVVGAEWLARRLLGRRT
jgi:hypothetical protein